MKLYIANTTRQNVDFYYRVPEIPGAPRMQKISIGGQILVSGDLNTPQIEAILSQHAPYGIVSADELDRVKGYVGLCFSIDKPVPAHKIERAMNENISILVRRGQQTRRESAVATSALIETELSEKSRPEILKNFEASIVEENPEVRGTEAGPAIAEGVRVNRLADPDGHIPETHHRAGKRRKAA